MKNILQITKNILNTALAPIGAVVSKKYNKNSDLKLYQETKRPEIPRYINIGAGGFYHPFWHNLDMPNAYYADSQKDKVHIKYDLRSLQPLPFNNDTIKVAYTSHVIEHINNNEVAYLFTEVYRCLQPGGYFRITCPDMDLEYEAFNRGDDLFWIWPNAYGVFNKTIEQKFLDHFATALTLIHPNKNTEKFSDQKIQEIFTKMKKEDAFDFLIHQIPPHLRQNFPGDHINWFNTNKLMTMLNESGFEKIHESKYRQSHSPLLRNHHLFDTTCPELSLYIECRK